jgi:hypothetical protein
MNRPSHIFLAIVLLTVVSCDSQKIFRSPPGYDLGKPEKFNMPESLHEISGIAFDQGRGDTIYAEQDEEGKLFHFRPGDKKMIVSRFGKPGDFEDVTICNGYVIMLRSDGVLFTFPLSEAILDRVSGVMEWKNMLPPGEFEGLCSNDSASRVYVLCKHCSDDRTSKRVSGYVFILKNGKLSPDGGFGINVKDIEAGTGAAKINFHPSAFTQNPVTKEYYILSSVNKLLVITDAAWNVREVYPLNPSIFPQPEGIAFDRNRTLYISNERNTAAHGTILKFAYHG